MKIDEFTIGTEEIGKGTTCTVFKAYRIHQETKKKQFFAAKIMDKAKIPLEKLLNELKILNLISKNRKNLLSLLRFEENPKKFIMIFDFFPQNLAEYLLKTLEIPLKKSLFFLKNLLKALEILRKYQIIHGDLKPANIFMTKDERLVLGDFGEAFLANSQKTCFCGGNVYYMAPESEKGEYSEKSDIWACGLVFYEILLGKGLWKNAGNMCDFLEERRNFRLDIGKNGRIKGIFEELLRKMLEIEPGKRASVKELLGMIEKYEGKEAFSESCGEESTKESEIFSIGKDEGLFNDFYENCEDLFEFFFGKVLKLLKELGNMENMEILLILKTFAMIFERKKSEIFPEKNGFFHNKKFKEFLQFLKFFENSTGKIAEICKKLVFSEKIIAFYDEFLMKTLDFFRTQVKNQYLQEKNVKKIDENLIILVRLMKKVSNYKLFTINFPCDEFQEKKFKKFYKMKTFETFEEFSDEFLQ